MINNRALVKRMVTKNVALFWLVSMLWVACSPLPETRSPVPEPSPLAASVPEVEPVPGGTLVFSFGVSDPQHFNPALQSGSATIIPGAQIFASPLRYDDAWNPQPYLAESWEVSEDGLAVTLHLVEGTSFHDGAPITSKDVAFSVMTVQQYHPFKTMFAPVTGVETPDPLTAVIRLSHPHPAILLAMSPPFLPILPQHIYGDGQDILTHPANLQPVGSGPFKFVSYTPGERIILARYENFFIPGRPYLDRIEFWIDTDPASQVVSLERQVAHLTSAFIDFPGLERMEAMDHLIVTRQGYEAIGPLNWLAFNLLREPLNDVRVRQAIAYAIDLDFIPAYLHNGLSQRAFGPIAPDSPFYEPDLPAYDHDPAKAAQLLDQAGYPLKDGLRFSITLDYIPIIPSQQRDVAYYVQSQLKEIGIAVQVRDSASFPAWAQRIGNWDFDLTVDAAFNWGDPVIGVHRTYISENIRQGTVWSNTQNYNNPQVDDILARAAVELDSEKRKAFYSEFQNIVTHDVPVIWINVIPFYTIYHQGLGNPPLTIWGVHSPLDEVFWRDLPKITYPPPPVLDADQTDDQVVSTGIAAIQLLQNNDFYTARARLRDPEAGFLDLAGTGLHVMGFTQDGVVFLDNSGQFQPGMDIRFVMDTGGDLILPRLVEMAQNQELAHLQIAGVWPHPVTQMLDPVAIWCGQLTADEIVCALSWFSHQEGTE